MWLLASLIQVLARATLIDAASATASGEASASSFTDPRPAAVSLCAKTGPIPSTASTGTVSTEDPERKVGGSGSREAATETKRSRIAQMSAAAPPTNPMNFARRLMCSGYPVA